MKNVFFVYLLSIGAAPLLSVLYWWQTMIWTYGHKYQDLLFDLRLLHQKIFGKNALLHWGSLEVTFWHRVGMVT